MEATAEENWKHIAGIFNSIEQQIDELLRDICNKTNEGNTTLEEAKQMNLLQLLSANMPTQDG